jgi:hypothetical protein
MWQSSVLLGRTYFIFMERGMVLTPSHGDMDSNCGSSATQRRTISLPHLSFLVPWSGNVECLFRSKDDILVVFKNKNQTTLQKRVLVSTTVLIMLWDPAVLLSCSRSAALIKYYSGPLVLYAQLPAAVTHAQVFYNASMVCTCGEWYRFPSSFFHSERIVIVWICSIYI